jgi:hypothetical protein
VIGGWQRGSLTPQMPPSLLPAIAPTATRAANSAARLTVVKLLIAKNIASSPIDAITLLSRLIYSEPRTSKGGPLLPRLCSPLLFFAFVASAVSRGREPARESAIIGRLPMVLARGLKTTLCVREVPTTHRRLATSRHRLSA